MDLAGKLLIAMPSIGDPQFSGSVIYVCTHSSEGTMGLIINKVMPNLKFSDILKQIKMTSSNACGDWPVHFGGSVESGRGFVLHSSDYRSTKDTALLPDGLTLTATRSILEAIAKGNSPARAIFALGYSGWGSGQLEDEIAQNAWLTADYDEYLVFGSDSATKWDGALAQIGVKAASLSSTAGRA
jgi:putative transcriptional regulator